jgi:hypothetical protein
MALCASLRTECLGSERVGNVGIDRHVFSLLRIKDVDDGDSLLIHYVVRVPWEDGTRRRIRIRTRYPFGFTTSNRETLVNQHSILITSSDFDLFHQRTRM